jgi:hypothetical protein
VMAIVFPFASIGPLIFLWLRRGGGRVRDLRYGLPFLIVPAIQFFYYYQDLRYYIELLPFVAVGTAAIFADLRRRAPRLSASLLVFLVAGSVFVSCLSLDRDAADFRRRVLPAFHAAERLMQENPHVLLFVRERPEDPTTFEDLCLFNAEKSADRIVVARDLGRRDKVLMRLYPNYRAFRMAETATRSITVEALR